MLSSIVERLNDARSAELEEAEAAEAGFTLIELMVVLLIIAILLAIAIPTFLGVTSSANDRAAQSNLTNALTEAQSQYQNLGQTYSGVGAALSSAAPEFSWTTGALVGDTSNNPISYTALDQSTAGDGNGGIILSAYSKATSTCWFVVTLVQAPPGTAVKNAGGTQTSFGGTEGGNAITTAGTYYASEKNPSGANACAASSAVSTFAWGPSYTSAGTN